MQIVIHYRDGREPLVVERALARSAIRYAEEEAKWESVREVCIPELNYSIPGDFAWLDTH